VKLASYNSSNKMIWPQIDRAQSRNANNLALVDLNQIRDSMHV